MLNLIDDSKFNTNTKLLLIKDLLINNSIKGINDILDSI